MNQFQTVRIIQVSRGQNTYADSLATLTSSLTEDIPRLIKVEVVKESSIDAKVTFFVISTPEPCWMDSIVDFLAENRLSSETKKAEKRQAPLIHQPARSLNLVSNPWPFAQWELDIIGPFPQATGNRRFVLVVVDYFTKWVEAKALVNIRDVDVKKFVWKNIVTRFGVLESFMSDNGLQFDSKAFRKYCGDLGINNRYSTPANPQSNGQAEATNKVIVDGLKKRLEGTKGRNDVESVGFVGRAPRIINYLPADYQKKLARQYNRGVKIRDFVAGDLVLRKVVGSARDVNAGKIAPSWEGPYRVTAIAGAGAYYLEDMEERPLPRPWNV
ncbi:uncharacterized protein LOC142608949 [Castanea sativa]|uniref:uncharacterized protein LOC142608949 n=1 Tax=Castanea sativa TaxID=21020 RepID=UPI003F64C5C1